MANDFSLTYAGVPFILDTALTVRMPYKRGHGTGPDSQEILEKHQVMADLIDEVNRLIPLHYLNDLTLPTDYPGRNIGALARPARIGPFPNPTVKVGDWYYPNGAQRWSIFRGLATSSQAAAMLAATQTSPSVPANLPQTLLMKQSPLSPDNASNSVASYTVQSSMYLLPPRPLAEHGGKLDGLYLITLVDERYWWQCQPIAYQPSNFSSWTVALQSVATILGITLTIPTVPSVYQNPEPDSSIWMNNENGAALFDALAANLGFTVVRNLDGTYRLRSGSSSQGVVASNRATVQVGVGPSPSLDTSQVVRTAGGDIFNSGTGTRLPIGDLSASRNLVVPSTVQVSFPYYVLNNDPIPHFADFRIQAPESTKWFQESYGDTFTQYVPIASGGPLVSGLAGTANQFQILHTTAKALVSGEANILFLSGQTIPINQSGLNALAMQLATNYYTQQVAAALDEVYPGTFAWTPEGLHDIIWTYSARSRQAVTRVMRTQWNNQPREFQHSTPAPGPQTFQADSITPIAYYAPGVDGPSIPQTIRDSYGSGWVGNPNSLSATLAQPLASGDATAILNGIAYLPTQNRWKGTVDSETIFFEGTSGGISQFISGTTYANTVNVVYRSIDGTNNASHASGTTVFQQLPNTAYGVKLTSYEKGQFVYPSEWTSGGIQGLRVVPQTQTVYTFTSSPTRINQIDHYSGRVTTYDPTKASGFQFSNQEPCWVTERNGNSLNSGEFFNGQLMGYSASGPVAPIYAVDSMPPGVVVVTSGITASGSQPGIPIYVSGRLTIIPCNFPTPIKTAGPPYPASIISQMQNVFGIDFLGSSGYNGQNYYISGSTFGMAACTSGSAQPGGTLPNSSVLGGTLYSNSPGLFWQTFYAMSQGDTGNYCTARVLPIISYPPPNNTTFINGYAYGYGNAYATNFVDSCTNKWTVNVNAACATIDISTNWQGVYVTGARSDGGNITVQADTLAFNTADFVIGSIAGKCPGLFGASIKTNGYTGNVTDVFSVTFNSQTCVLTVQSQTLIYQDGLLQNGSYQ